MKIYTVITNGGIVASQLVCSPLAQGSFSCHMSHNFVVTQVAKKITSVTPLSLPALHEVESSFTYHKDCTNMADNFVCVLMCLGV